MCTAASASIKCWLRVFRLQHLIRNSQEQRQESIPPLLISVDMYFTSDWEVWASWASPEPNMSDTTGEHTANLETNSCVLKRL